MCWYDTIVLRRISNDHLWNFRNLKTRLKKGKCFAWMCILRAYFRVFTVVLLCYFGKKFLCRKFFKSKNFKMRRIVVVMPNSQLQNRNLLTIRKNFRNWHKRTLICRVQTCNSKVYNEWHRLKPDFVLTRWWDIV